MIATLLKKLIRPFLQFLGPLKPVAEGVCQFEAAVSRRWASSAHARLMAVQWSLPPQPEHFDHHNDLFYWWLKSRNSLWLERGIYGALALKGGKVLELACGDGFNARNFYSIRSERVVACDFDPRALATARRKNSAPNVEYVLADIRTAMPEGCFDNVVWDAAIEHFTLDETAKILRDIKQRLTRTGVLSGYTMVDRKDGTKFLTHHEYEFQGKEDLHQILVAHFKHVTVFETIYPSRHNLYFWASDAVVPFDRGWPHVVTESR
jgi:SAM-dependent methyltransferase